MTDKTIIMKRRSFLTVTAGALATPYFYTAASAQDRTMYVGVYNSAQGGLIKKEVIPAFEKEYKCRVLTTEGATLANIATLRATRENPQYSVMSMDDVGVPQAKEEGLIEQLRADEIIVPPDHQHDGDPGHRSIQQQHRRQRAENPGRHDRGDDPFAQDVHRHQHQAGQRQREPVGQPRGEDHARQRHQRRQERQQAAGKALRQQATGLVAAERHVARLAGDVEGPADDVGQLGRGAHWSESATMRTIVSPSG